METDINGCSTTQPGCEQYECFTSKINRKKYIQYDYRTESGALFSTVARTLNKCREQRDEWLSKIN